MKTECIQCPRMLKMQFTPEGHKFCVYCNFKAEVLKQNDDSRNEQHVFESDWRMGIANLLQMWKTKPHLCAKCKSKRFVATVEEFVPPQEGIFKPKPTQRIVLTCKKCGDRTYPDEHMRTKGLK
jgi:hypothetical protein